MTRKSLLLKYYGQTSVVYRVRWLTSRCVREQNSHKTRVRRYVGSWKYRRQNNPIGTHPWRMQSIKKHVRDNDRLNQFDPVGYSLSFIINIVRANVARAHTRTHTRTMFGLPCYTTVYSNRKNARNKWIEKLNNKVLGYRIARMA